MTELTHNVRAADVVKPITLHIRMSGLTAMRLRMRLGALLFRFASWVAGCNVEIESGDLPHAEHRTYQTQNGELIPNQMSVHDRNFDSDLAMRLDIRLDGVIQKRVVAYDADAGIVRRQVVDKQGNVKLNPTRDEVLTEIVRGKVELELAR